MKTRASLLVVLASPALLHACSDAAPAQVDAAAAESFTNDAGMTFVYVPSGAFEMGSPETDVMHRKEELPRHTVEIQKALYVSTTETTVGQFRRFVEETGYETEAERDPRGGFGFDMESGEPLQVEGMNWEAPGFEQTDEHPVVQVSWVDAEAFCGWLSEKDGRTYRLPTEAEWEYFCRAGTETRWWFGNDPAGLKEVANVADQSLTEVFPAIDWAVDWNDGYPFTAPVAQWKPNPLGLYDVTGNAWEWCADWFDEEWYARSPEAAPLSSDGDTMRSIRGGGWYDPDWRTRSAQRAWFFPVFRYCMLSSFRVVCDA